MDIHVFPWHNHENVKSVFYLLKPVYDMDTYKFKVNVFTKQAEYE